MINSIRITNHLGESITLEMRSLEESGLFIRDIDGLNPPKADINLATIANGDGSVLNSSRVNSRNVVLSLGYGYISSIEVCRHKVYKYLPIKKQVILEINSDSRVCQATGSIESNDINIFGKQQGSIVSILCADAYLYSATPNITVLSGLDVQFEFPFSNESLTEDLIILSNVLAAREATIVYDGDAAVGIVIRIHATGSVTNLRVANLSTTELMTFDDAKLIELLGSGISAGDDIVISTIKGSKFVTLTRSAITYDILYVIGQSPDWFELQKGDNLFTYLADTGLSNLTFEIENRVAYEGV